MSNNRNSLNLELFSDSIPLKVDSVLKVESVDIVCPYCSSGNYRKAGIRAGKQRYKCKHCGRQFIQQSSTPRYSPDEKYSQYEEVAFDFNHDIWTFKQLGMTIQPNSKNSKILNFKKIQQAWLKKLVKRFILYVYSTHSFSSLTNHYLVSFNCFSSFLKQKLFDGRIEDISRSIILDYIAYTNHLNLSAQSRGDRLSTLSLFFEIGNQNEWFKLKLYLIRKEDYPKKTSLLPRFIPEEIIQQLNQHLHNLPDPIMRMVLVLQECGLRIGELCQLPFDCLNRDSKGQYRIQFMRWKTKKEDVLPISPELARVIQEQQQYIREQLGTDFPYLFCGRKAIRIFAPESKVMSSASFVQHLIKLAEDFDIRDNSGKRWHFQTHQFRHTVGTRMINSGVPQYIVQRYLGHESPTMTMVYAHVFDETLRKEIEKYHESRVVNFQGETIELKETILSSDDELEWFKKNIQARALEHGYCARPKILGDCDVPGFDGCYNCPHWRTNKNFLPVLKDTLERTDKVIEKARNCGWELQVKKNEPIQHNLLKVIKSLEEDNNEQKN